MGLKPILMTNSASLSNPAALQRRPLLVTDCDEVILHMIVPFGQWLDEIHAINLDLNADELSDMLTHRDTGDRVDRERIWPLFEEFFESEMDRQTPFPDVVDALSKISAVADIVVLTNTGKAFEEARTRQLEAHGLALRVVANSGGKGPPLAALIAEYQPTVALFIDDLPQHIGGARDHAPDCWRLHMVGEPQMAGRVKPAPDAHARIDHWADALPYILDIFARGEPASTPTPVASAV